MSRAQPQRERNPKRVDAPGQLAFRNEPATGTGTPGLPQPIQAVLALTALALSSPVLVVCAVAVRLSSRGPVIFRQERVGRDGVPFTLYKFRTMRIGASGSQVTAGGDARVTPVGRILRTTKLDELPELWNVANGTMSLVGSRPEVPRYVDLRDPLWRAVLAERPGITSPVTIRLRNEEALMASVPPARRETFYARTLLPYKLLGHLAYVQQRTPLTDLRVLIDTAAAIVLSRRWPLPSIAEIAQVAGNGPTTG
jgi:lipopolysaccharide/colanic/teichoic acid biosynthesis glycosyltransferase